MPFFLKTKYRHNGVGKMQRRKRLKLSISKHSYHGTDSKIKDIPIFIASSDQVFILQ